MKIRFRKSCWKPFPNFEIKQNMGMVLFFLFMSTYLAADEGSNLCSFYPIQHGLCWNYFIHEDGKAFSQDVQCKRLSDSLFCLSTKSCRKSIYFFSIEQNAIFLNHFTVNLPVLPLALKIKVEPSLPVFYFDKQIGDSWEWNGAFSFSFSRRPSTIRSFITDMSQIKIDDTFVDYLEIISEINVDGKTDTLVVWYAKDIGLIKQFSHSQNKTLCRIDNPDAKPQVFVDIASEPQKLIDFSLNTTASQISIIYLSPLLNFSEK